ncbi:alpha-E domain-containing protein [Conexibacter sp. SYSU D00693]|uniref:alpha-E domain-containing protein n=1 Tax=Conexibacter sp. SYSU D00693 TaxID=2812560 RepID=UPI00196B839F|nr:alpha-E domain-containing protein [Conexibacter sp. SYSU D00693]
MLARIAHELFWLGRNITRAEHTARMLDGVFQADLQARPSGPTGVAFGWRSILATMGVDPGTAPVRRDDVLRRLTLDRDEPASIVSCVERSREQARTVRDVISAEMWESLNTTHLRLRDGDMEGRLATSPYAVLRDVRERCALFWGLMQRTMLRDEARSFLVAGGRIESADMVLRMLRVALPGDEVSSSDGQALALLQAVGGFQAFRRAVPAPANARPVMRFLVYEAAYPDSVAASIAGAQVQLEVADHAPRSSEPVLRLSRLGADLELRARSTEGDDLAAVCAGVQAELAAVDRDIAERYFAGAAPLGVVSTV